MVGVGQFEVLISLPLADLAAAATAHSQGLFRHGVLVRRPLCLCSCEL